MSLLNRFVSQVEFQSYEDFKQNFKIIVPENFNFAFDVVDVYAKEDPKKDGPWFGATTEMKRSS